MTTAVSSPSRRPLPLRAATLSGAVITALAAPLMTVPAHAATVTVEGVHTDVVSMDITDHTLDMFSYVDFPGGPHTKVDPREAVFILPDDERTRRSVPAGYEFIAPQGEEVIIAPQTQIPGVLWPGWNTEDIRKGEVVGDALTMELEKIKAPEGASVEVFQEGWGGGAQRIWSSDEPEYGSYIQPVGSHVHSNWAFTDPGRYELTFHVQGTEANGQKLDARQTYVFEVGEVSESTPAESAPAQPVPSESAPAEPAPTESAPTESVPAEPDPSESAPAQPVPSPSAPVESVPAESTPAKSEPAQPTEPHQSGSSAPQPSTPDSAAPAPADAAPAVPGGTRPLPPSNDGAPKAPGGKGPAQCIPTEVPLPGVAGQSKAAEKRPEGSSLSSVQEQHHAAPHLVDVVTDGHFDLGPQVQDGRLTAAVKDDRTAPSVWKDPRTLTFGLGDAAKTTMPAGMEDVAPAGSEVYLIGATQEQGVPWVGWNTQNESLLREAAGPMTMSLASVQGPGELSVFLSGNFGSGNTPVFSTTGQKSFTVPLHTHQHGNWVFTQPGDYQVVVDLSVP